MRRAPVLPGPVVVASGCAGTGRELSAFTDAEGLELVTRSISLDAVRDGEPRRVLETPGGVLTTASAHTPGLEHFLATELPPLVRAGTRVHVSVVGAGTGQFVQLARRLALAPGVAGLELNLGDPNAEAQGHAAAHEPFQVSSLVHAVRREFGSDRPLTVKLRADVAQLVDLARACQDAEADAVVLGHGLAAALPDGTPAVLSGAAVGPVTVRAVRTLRDAVPSLPVIACGGVADPRTASAYLDLGAAGVQVGSALMRDPTCLAAVRSAVDARLRTTHTIPDDEHDHQPGGLQ